MSTIAISENNRYFQALAQWQNSPLGKAMEDLSEDVKKMAIALWLLILKNIAKALQELIVPLPKESEVQKTPAQQKATSTNLSK